MPKPEMLFVLPGFDKNPDAQALLSALIEALKRKQSNSNDPELITKITELLLKVEEKKKAIASAKEEK